MRLDEVPHAAEVPSLEKGAKIVDVAGINTWIFTLPREVSDRTGYGLRSQQKS
jgi:hypothetical protein